LDRPRRPSGCRRSWAQLHLGRRGAELPRRAGESSSERSVEDGFVDTVVAVGVVEGELRLAGSSPRPSTRRRSCGQSEMFKDAPGDPFILDDSNQSHRPLAPRASENVGRVRAPHEHRPVQPTLPTGIIGDDNVVSPRMNTRTFPETRSSRVGLMAEMTGA
jgi:hypothetical protein